jgi:hypothetical protein
MAIPGVPENRAGSSMDDLCSGRSRARLSRGVLANQVRRCVVLLRWQPTRTMPRPGLAERRG